MDASFQEVATLLAWATFLKTECHGSGRFLALRLLAQISMPWSSWIMGLPRETSLSARTCGTIACTLRQVKWWRSWPVVLAGSMARWLDTQSEQATSLRTGRLGLEPTSAAKWWPSQKAACHWLRAMWWRLRPAAVAGFMAAWLDLQNVMAISRRHVCQGLFVS
ncbi:unnamed protein product [Symbiodinium pilosum]|uniref:Uncharacterized protein n=1 Tax=Symbiodinium pilosum TaxID=2952 RepID=A0A812XBE1_SYMPI|nr:unnamed protein product [Symbiodinium pilosum]